MTAVFIDTEARVDATFVKWAKTNGIEIKPIEYKPLHYEPLPDWLVPDGEEADNLPIEIDCFALFDDADQPCWGQVGQIEENETNVGSSPWFFHRCQGHKDLDNYVAKPKEQSNDQV